MVANWASSRGHIGLSGGAPCGGGAGGFICAEASTLSAPTPNSTAQAKIHRERGVISVSGISGRLYRSAQAGILESAANAASLTCFSGQRHVVSGAPVWQVATPAPRKRRDAAPRSRLSL